MQRILRPLAALALALPFAALAGPDAYVISPNIEYGEREVDFKAGTYRLREDGSRISAASLGLGWGATPSWFTEAYLKYEKEGSARARYDAFEWENRFQLTETNKYAVDVGLLTEIEVPRERRTEGYELAFGPLLQWDTGDVRWNANLIFERVIRSHDEESHHLEFGYRLQARQDLSPAFGVGVQAFGEMGKWNHWEPASGQSHRVGPALFGKVKLGGHQAIKYNAALLFPATHASPKSGLRVQAEYEF